MQEYKDIITDLHTMRTARMLITGSHYFGNTHDESDYDVCCGPMKHETINEIVSLGFEREHVTNTFGGVLSVWKHKDHDIHILEVDDIEKRFELQDIIRTKFPKGYTDKKNNAKGIWELAEDIYKMESKLERLTAILEE